MSESLQKTSPAEYRLMTVNHIREPAFCLYSSSQGLPELSEIHLHILHHETLSYHCLSGLRDQYPRYRYTITNICYQHCLTIFYPSLCTLETNRRQRQTRQIRPRMRRDPRRMQKRRQDRTLLPRVYMLQDQRSLLQWTLRYLSQSP